MIMEAQEIPAANTTSNYLSIHSATPRDLTNEQWISKQGPKFWIRSTDSWIRYLKKIGFKNLISVSSRLFSVVSSPKSDSISNAFKQTELWRSWIIWSRQQPLHLTIATYIPHTNTAKNFTKQYTRKKTKFWSMRQVRISRSKTWSTYLCSQKS